MIVDRSTKDFMARVLIDRRNQRLRVLDYRARDLPGLTAYLGELARSYGTGKTIIYASRPDWQGLLGLGYRLEGRMAGYFTGEPAYCMSRFTDSIRAGNDRTVAEDELLERIMSDGRAKKISNSTRISAEQTKYRLRLLERDDIDAVIKAFRLVFPTYPSPVEDYSYFKAALENDDFVMMVAEADGEIAGIISADIDFALLCAEVTDCITVPAHRGKGILGSLIEGLERELQPKALQTLFSLARAGVPAMNAALYNRGYEYRGRLINNCHIGGKYENMNIWEKVDFSLPI